MITLTQEWIISSSQSEYFHLITRISPFNVRFPCRQGLQSTAMPAEPTRFQLQLLEWYDRNRRDLPWRQSTTRAVSPFGVFLSEAMLQQTQVATVVPYFNRFIKKLPDFASLSAADEQTVLRLWQGLGYYRRARHLHAAARQIVSRHNGKLPRSVDALMELPGVGRYTAGAIASIAFDVKAPILDGNVARVLCRMDRIKADPREPATRDRLWKRAEEILPDRRIGDFNSALMELGATVCTPRAPKCPLCPMQTYCRARATGDQDHIPPPRRPKSRPRVVRWTFCIRNRSDAWLIERRPQKGRWAGLWQFVTIETKPPMRDLHRRLGMRVSPPQALTTIEHGLTHRQYEFKIFICDARDDVKGFSSVATNRERAWTTLAGLGEYPLPRPHLKIAELLEKQAADS